MHTVCLDWLTEQVRCPVQNYCYLQCENCVVSTQYNKSLFGKAENWPRSFFWRVHRHAKRDIFKYQLISRVVRHPR